MTMIAGQIGGLKTHLVGYDTRTTAAPVGTFFGYEGAFITSYIDHFQFHNPWAPGWSRMPVGEYFGVESVLTGPELKKTEFYNDWVRPQDDMVGGGGTVLLRDRDRVFMFGGNLPGRESTRSAARQQQLFDLITPFMVQALEVGRMFAELRIDAVALRAGVEPRQAAMFTLGLGGRVLQVNDAGKTLLDRGELRLSPAGQLVLATPEAQTALARALAPARAGLACHPASFRITRPVPPRQYRVLPVDPEDVPPLLTPTLGTTPAVALLICQALNGLVAPEERIISATGLTRTEAEIALQIADGQDLSEIAEARRVSIHAVRNQVKAALSKTGLRRQADLVGLVERLRK